MARHRNRRFRSAVALGLGLGFVGQVQAAPEPNSLPHRIMEGYPEEMAIALNQHERDLRALVERKALDGTYSLIIPATRRWDPGSTLDVAFNGGSPALYAQIESAAQAWTAPGVANIKLRFRDAAGAWNVWSTLDQTHRAEIRIAFGPTGQWSAVGKGSIDRTLPGGKPHEASMNLEGFDERLPPDWKGVVRHEFGHALGFQHEHQSPAGACDFRYFDDRDYKRQVDSEGWFRVDDWGRRPGLYTFLGGKANRWGKRRVDENMKPIKTSSAYDVGPFDKHSIMKYYFDSWQFEGGEESGCFTKQNAEDLSPGDIAGARRAYPSNGRASAEIILRNSQTLKDVQAADRAPSRLKASMAERLNLVTQ